MPAIFTDSGIRRVQWASQALPTFHAMGFYWQIIMPLASGIPAGLYAPQYPEPPVVPTADNVLEASRITGCNAIPAVPSHVEVSCPVLVWFFLAADRSCTDVGEIA
jgi:hypothetical protein